jgi:proteasome lid subunit RPN8/RPN11
MKIIISNKLDKILKHLVKKNPREFTLYGRTRIEGEDVYLEEVRVPFQESTFSSTDADQDTFVDELAEEGLDPLNWNMWIHSHNSMGAFWSGQDKEQMYEFNKGITQHFFHMVMSEKGRKACYTLYKPFLIEIDELPIEVQELDNPEVIELIKQREDIEKKIEELNSSLPEETNTLQELLDERNSKKSYSKDYTKDDGFEDLYKPKSTVDVLNHKERKNEIKRLQNICKYHNHGVDAECLICDRLDNLYILDSLPDKYVSKTTLDEWYNTTHSQTCNCNICRGGQAMLNLGLC